MTDPADAEILALLPPSLRRIAGAAGLDAAMRLVRDLGGTRVSLSTRPGGPLVRAIGADAAAAVVALMHDGEIAAGWRYYEVPRVPAAYHAAIRAAVAGGMSKPAVARRFQLTERWVRKICNELPGQVDDRQACLF